MLLGSSVVSAFLVAVLCVFIVRQGREEAGKEEKKKKGAQNTQYLSS